MAEVSDISVVYITTAGNELLIVARWRSKRQDDRSTEIRLRQGDVLRRGDGLF